MNKKHITPIIIIACIIFTTISDIFLLEKIINTIVWSLSLFIILSTLGGLLVYTIINERKNNPDE